MKTGRLRKVTGFWKNLTFTGNMCRMRSALSEYLQEEGVKNYIEDGMVVFDFDGDHFCVMFCIDKGYPECEITYLMEDDDYKSLDIQDKTYIADKVNTDIENHCVVYAFNDNIRVSTSFYFTGKKMMLTLFSEHFQELTESVALALDIIRSKITNHNDRKGRRIGFNMDNQQSEETSEATRITAKTNSN